MLQRVGLAQAILHDPKLMILDEPMSGLDPVGRREVRDIILDLKNAGKSILFSTHILSDAETLCDRVGVIAGGRLRGVGAPGSIVGVKSLGMEIIFELTESGGPQIEKIRAKAAKSGANYRMNASDAELYAALAELREAGAKIISVTQIKPTLEDFFMELVGKDRARASAIEVSGQ
jgi:ABC-2 type transport system ATP-binding protein